MYRRLGFFGGSFDPVHIGHCCIAENFVEQLRLDRCYFVPTFVSPFKSDHVSIATSAQRLQMLKVVTRSNPRFSVDDFELRRKGISYTIETVRHLQERHSNTELFMLIGEDQARNFMHWKNWKDILDAVQVCIASRSMNSDCDSREKQFSHLYIDGSKPHFISAPLLDISSTDVRERLQSGRSARYLIPEKVNRFIVKHRLYKG